MRFYDALKSELETVTADNWRDKLDALKASNGTWAATARALGVDKRTVERWRAGYQPRARAGQPRPGRRQVDPQTFLGKIRAAFVKDRPAQVAAVDWKRMTAVATWWNGKYRREQVMHLGAYMSDPEMTAVAGAYVNKDRNGMSGIMNNVISNYLGFDAKLADVESVTF